MTGPFHAIGVLRPNLRSTGFGQCDLARHTDLALRCNARRDPRPGLGATPVDPILFPGNGTTTNLDHFVVESPEPADLLQLDRQRRPADHRHDARGGRPAPAPP